MLLKKNFENYWFVSTFIFNSLYIAASVDIQRDIISHFKQKNNLVSKKLGSFLEFQKKIKSTISIAKEKIYMRDVLSSQRCSKTFTLIWN